MQSFQDSAHCTNKVYYLSNKKVFVPTQIFRDKIITRLQCPLVFKGNQHQFKSVVPLLLSAATSCEVSRG